MLQNFIFEVASMKSVDTACWVATQDPSERQTFTLFYSPHVTRT